ncbi:hypothetical protein PS947_06009 [Pseudomonas fluorescens]|nr:hypothetical protein PS947_06009 [Pseudomonas fluorescens]
MTAQQDLEVALPNSLVAFNLGKTVKVIYTVIRNSAPQDSEELSLAVLPIADGDQNLPTPTIDGVAGDELDVTPLEEGAQLRIEKWMLQALGQRIWLCYNGTDKNGNAVEKVFWTGEAYQQAVGLVTAAQVAWLRELKDGLPLTITFKVNFAKVANIDTAVVFPSRTYTIKNSTFIYEDFETTPLQDFKHYVPVTLSSGLKIKVQLDTSTPSSRAQIALTDSQNGSGAHTYLASHNSNTEFSWPVNAKSISFLYRFSETTTITILYTYGRAPYEKIAPNNFPKPFEHIAPTGRSIKSIYIATGGLIGDSTFSIDNIKIDKE